MRREQEEEKVGESQRMLASIFLLIFLELDEEPTILLNKKRRCWNEKIGNE